MFGRLFLASLTMLATYTATQTADIKAWANHAVAFEKCALHGLAMHYSGRPNPGL